MRNRTTTTSVLGASLFALMLVCCGGGVGKVVQPEDFTGKDALGGGGAAVKCVTPKAAEPLLVDLPLETRGELESHLMQAQGGVAIVAYDCTSLRVLSDCHVETGPYAYQGWSMKSNIVEMRGADELKANLPLGAVKLDGEVKSGRSIELALLNIGARSTTVTALERERLTGECTGATHFVKKAFIGAFSLSTSSAGKAAAAAEMFGKGASGSSEAQRNAALKEGAFDACKGADPEADKPPTDCRVPVRAVLVPLADKLEPSQKTAQGDGSQQEKGKKEPKKLVADPDPCPPGFGLQNGACRKNVTTHVCDPKSLEECTTQCEKADARSCFNLGFLKMEAEDMAGAKTAFEKACTAGLVDGCAGVAETMVPKRVTNKTLPEAKAALEKMKAACDDGSILGCWDAALYLHDQAAVMGAASEKLKDVNLGFKYAEKGCKLGDGDACQTAADDLLFPEDAATYPKDPARAAMFLQKGCDAGANHVCNVLGEYLLGGKYGMAKDVERSVKLLWLACEKDADLCESPITDLAKAGRTKEALAQAKRACEGGKELFKVDGCKKLGDFHMAGVITKKDPAAAKAAYERSKDGEKELCEAGMVAWCPKEPAPKAAKPKPKPAAKKKW